MLTNLWEYDWKGYRKGIMKIIAPKGINSLRHHNLVHNFSDASSIQKKLDAKGAVDKEREKLEKITSMAADESQKQERGDRWSKGWKVHFASLMDFCHLKSSEFVTTISKIQRSSWTPRWHCKRWFWIIRSIYWTRIISITDDCCKSNGCQSKATRMRRTSSRRSLSLHSGQNGRCTVIKENSKVRMSRYLDTSTKTHMAQIIVQHGRPSRSSRANSLRSSFGRTIWESQFEKVLLEHGWEKVPNWECLFVNRGEGWFLSVYVDDIKLAGTTENMEPAWKILIKEGDLGEPTSFLDHVCKGCPQTITEVCSKQGFQLGPWKKATVKLDAETISSRSFDMEGHAKKCVERYCELANKTTEQLYKVSTPCMDDHQSKEEEKGEISTVCSHVVHKCLYFTRVLVGLIFHCLWINMLVRPQNGQNLVTNVRRVWSRTFITHVNTGNIVIVGNTAQQCRLGLFQDSDFAWDFEDSKSTSGGILCNLGSHTFVPRSWMRKKQTSVSHRSTESEIISLCAGLRMDGISALDLWDLVIEVLHSCSNQAKVPKEQAREDLQRDKPSSKHTNTQHPNQDSNSPEWSWVIHCRLGLLKREILSLWRLALHVRRWWSGDQDDH